MYEDFPGLYSQENISKVPANDADPRLNQYWIPIVFTPDIQHDMTNLLNDVHDKISLLRIQKRSNNPFDINPITFVLGELVSIDDNKCKRYKEF